MADRRYLAPFLPLLILAAGLGITFLVFLQARVWVEEDLLQKLAHESEQLAARMQQQFALQEETLRGLTGLFIASDAVRREDFRAYLAQMDLHRRFPAAVEFRYARHLRREEIPRWQRQVAASLAAAGESPILPEPHPGGVRDEYLLVEFIHPFDPNIIGLDLLQSPRRQAIERLRAGAHIALSERLTAEYPGAPHYALLARLPETAGDPLPGTVALIFRPDRLIQDITATVEGLDLELYDRPANAPPGSGIHQPIFDTLADDQPPHVLTPQGLQVRRPLQVGDAEWTLVVTALPDWAPLVQNRWFPIIVGAIGVLLTLPLTLAASLLVKRWRQAEASLSLTWDDLLRAQAVAGVGSWHLDAATNRLIWTPQVYEIFGLAREEPVDYARYLACVHPDDRERVDAAWHAALRGEPYRIEHRIVVGNETRWVEERAELVFDANGKFIEAHGTVRDITRQREAEEALRQLNAELEARVAERTRRLEELLVQRQEFLATMSHEIRTPLTGLLGMLELMSLSPLPPEERHQLAITRESGKALTRIIDDILDYSKIEAGRLTLSPQPEDLRALIEGVRDAYLATASAKGISLMSFVDPRLPQALVMDGLRVRQILQNFVSNALKFTAEGYVEIRAEWLGEEDGQVTLKLAVRDTGIGIAPGLQQHLFERYSQADATTARRYGGTGLGLAICKHLVELMNGSIGCESEPARGSTFFVILTLPVAEWAPAVSPAATGDALRRLDAGGRPVLVADDHPTNRALIARQLALLGLAVDLAENGNQALAKWKHGDYALLVTDVHMPVMDGLELAQAVRAIELKEGRKPTPIIAWTAAAMGEEVARCRAAGMDDVLVKPTELAVLRATLARWLPFAAANGAVTVDGNAVLDRGVLERLAEGAEEERLILADFISQTRRDLAELDAALARDDAAAASRQAHRIKGAARMVGAARLAARAARAEDAARRHDLAEVTARLHEMTADLTELEAGTGHAEPPPAAQTDDAPPVWDGAVLTDMVGESPMLQRELIDSFFAHADMPLQEMRAAYEKREARPLARAAHKLKSAARAIGALELASLCAEIEAAGNNADWEAAAASYQKIDDVWARLTVRLQGERT